MKSKTRLSLIAISFIAVEYAKFLEGDFSFDCFPDSGGVWISARCQSGFGNVVQASLRGGLPRNAFQKWAVNGQQSINLTGLLLLNEIHLSHFGLRF